ncbi:MAG: serine/threonine protein kinase [Candidatus Eisenbacteria bacterium]|nr:serine/threonine protein kinase [Candidatus Eisenbacteria bacterium]MCC7142052.1 serine/threonine protein kinase [Candidatus Eisenbacteria bacterium]
MKWISDAGIARLRAGMEEPDLTGTKYRLRSLLSRGGMGAVYLVDDLELERTVALKLLALPDPTPEDLARLTQEARILAQLEHPGIVPIHDVGSLADGRLYYVMKWVRGVRLDARMPVSLEEAVSIVERLCEAVAFAHAHGVIHRDLKPENVMVGEFGEVLVLDWGVAKVRPQVDARPERTAALGTPASPASPPSLPNGAGTQPGTILGTPGYMAPEQERGEDAGPATDVWGLGALLHYLLSGSPPPRDPAERGGSLPPSVPRPLASIVRKALAPTPEARFAGALEVRDDLLRFRAREPVTAHRESLFERIARLAGKYRTPILIIVAYLVMRAALILWLRR